MSNSTPIQKSALIDLSQERYDAYLEKAHSEMASLVAGDVFSYPNANVSLNVGRRDHFKEVGVPGLRIYSGFLEEEFLPELRGHLAARVYQEMRDNDPTVGALMYVMEHLIQNASLIVATNGDSDVDLAARELVETAMNDMVEPWQHVLSEILTFMPFGYSYLETTMKHRRGENRDPNKDSKHEDGMIGWASMKLRGQDTTYRWHMSKTMDVLAMEQLPPPHFINTLVPREKALHFRTKAWKSNPEGISLLRNAYRPWFFMKRIEEIEAIAVERELNGMPVLQPPEGYNLWNPNDPLAGPLLARAEAIVQNIRQDRHQGIVLPFGWVLTLLSSQGTRSLDTSIIINRYAQRIATVVLADMLLIGQERVGSFALVAAKVSLFSKALRSIARIIEGEFNRKAIPRLIRMNGMNVENMPEIKFGPIDTPDLKSLGEYVNKLVGNNVLTPDQDLEGHMRELASMPPRLPEDMSIPPQGDPNDPFDDNDDPNVPNEGPRAGPNTEDAFSDKPTEPAQRAFPEEGKTESA